MTPPSVTAAQPSPGLAPSAGPKTRQVEIAVLGAGGAGLSLLAAVDRAYRAADLPRRTQPPSMALIDPVHRSRNDRTWCFWDDGLSPIEPAVHRSWRQFAIIDRHGAERRHRLSDLRYVMVRSGDFYALAEEAATRLGAERIQSSVELIHAQQDRVVIELEGEVISARWVFDSRPVEPQRAGRTTLLQHFRGWYVRFNHGALDPELPVLMDFTVPQPDRGTAFVYVLPIDSRYGLVEYTQFSPQVLPDSAYDAELSAYLVDRWGSGGAVGTYSVAEVESGVIPMTDGVFARQVGERIFRIGTAGGATRPSTGYTFAAMQRQATAIAGALVAGRRPSPPVPHARHHRWMDAIMLRALDRGMVQGDQLFPTLFARKRPDDVLRFLDGDSSPVNDLHVAWAAPKAPMVRAAWQDATARVADRSRR